MIAKLKGTVDDIFDDNCIIDVHGVGYLVFASAKTLATLQKGQAASLLVETLVREDSISLFGFSDAWEKEWFLTLTKVQGVGAKVALSILSALKPTELSAAVAAQDKNSFLRAAGVGPKLAARLTTELKDKIVTIPLGQVAVADEAVATAFQVPSQTPDVLEDVISALVNLGYTRLDAYKAASSASARYPDAKIADLIRHALQEIVKGGF